MLASVTTEYGACQILISDNTLRPHSPFLPSDKALPTQILTSHFALRTCLLRLEFSTDIVYLQRFQVPRHCRVR